MFEIIFLIVLIYLFRTIAFVWIEKYILSIEHAQHYSKEILLKIRKILEIIVIVININMVVKSLLSGVNIMNTILKLKKLFLSQH